MAAAAADDDDDDDDDAIVSIRSAHSFWIDGSFSLTFILDT